MHPQLDKNRFHSCEALMDALEECHRTEFLKQALGLCNFEKDELAKCLKSTRLDAAREKILQTREKQKAAELRKKRIEEETYGKNSYLRKVVEQAKKAGDK